MIDPPSPPRKYEINGAFTVYNDIFKCNPGSFVSTYSRKCLAMKAKLGLALLVRSLMIKQHRKFPL